MCGRLTSTHTPAQIAEELGAYSVISGDLPASYNLAPTDTVPTVVEHVDEDGKHVRTLDVMKWGLVPIWAKDPAIGGKMINARLETARTKPAFRNAFERRRCVVAASGFYEWQRKGAQKQPWYIYPREHGVLKMAGLYENWHSPEGRRLTTCTILTTAADDDMGQLHDRAPVLVPDEMVADWLDPLERSTDHFESILVAGVPGLLQAHPVDPAVGNVKNNYASLIEAVA